MLPHGRHTLGRECNFVVSIGVLKNVGREPRWCRPTISSFHTSPFPVKGVSKYRPHGHEPSVARTSQHPWLRPGWKIFPTGMGYCFDKRQSRRISIRATSLIVIAAGGALSPVRLKKPGVPLEQLSSWRNAYSITRQSHLYRALPRTRDPSMVRSLELASTSWKRDVGEVTPRINSPSGTS